jgi:hypothetical protein
MNRSYQLIGLAVGQGATRSATPAAAFAVGLSPAPDSDVAGFERLF